MSMTTIVTYLYMLCKYYSLDAAYMLHVLNPVIMVNHMRGALRKLLSFSLGRPGLTHLSP